MAGPACWSHPEGLICEKRERQGWKAKACPSGDQVKQERSPGTSVSKRRFPVLVSRTTNRFPSSVAVEPFPVMGHLTYQQRPLPPLRYVDKEPTRQASDRKKHRKLCAASQEYGFWLDSSRREQSRWEHGSRGRSPDARLDKTRDLAFEDAHFILLLLFSQTVKR